MPTRLAFYTPEQAAEVKGCSLSAIYRGLKEHRIRGVNIGSAKKNQRWLISVHELTFYEPEPFNWRNHRRVVKRRKQAYESQSEFEARCASYHHRKGG